MGIEAMLETFGHKQAIFLGHSYGTFICSWIVRERPHLVKKLVLLDPTNLCLAQPDVAYNFIYAPPINAIHLFIIYFVRREIFAGNVLMRHFHWYHNALWTDELPDDCIVAIGGSEIITDG